MICATSSFQLCLSWHSRCINIVSRIERKQYVDASFSLVQSDAAAPASNEYLDAIQAALKAEPKGTEFNYTERDVMLYNLGIGAKRNELKYIL